MNENKDLTISEIFTLGVQNHQKNNFLVAVKLYEKVIKIDPLHIYALNNLGAAFNKLGEYQKANDYFKKAIKIDPKYTEAINNLAAISLKLKNLENSYNEDIKFLELKSQGIVTNAKLENVISKFAKKIIDQNGIPTFFDNALNIHLTKNKEPTSDYCDIFEKGQLSKENRFVSYSKRLGALSESLSGNRLYDGLPFLASQGVHSLIRWKELPLYKSTFDLTIYSMMLQEVKPDIIIELGSGSGASALWLADTASALGLNTHVYSFDINKPLINHNKVTFIEQDLNKIDKLNKSSFWEFFKGKKILIEDAHVNVNDLLHMFDSILKKDDYLIIEDSSIKQDIISHFAHEKEPKYKLDQFFLDFFGTNITSCINSIFKCN
jgi:cephalosporin hydroxylase